MSATGETAALPSAGYRRNVFFCSFCKAPLTKVDFVVAAADAAICGACIDDCRTLADQRRAENAKPVEGAS